MALPQLTSSDCDRDATHQITWLRTLLLQLSRNLGAQASIDGTVEWPHIADVVSPTKLEINLVVDIGSRNRIISSSTPNICGTSGTPNLGDYELRCIIQSRDLGIRSGNLLQRPIQLIGQLKIRSIAVVDQDDGDDPPLCGATVH
jgi:hypothetical protein